MTKYERAVYEIVTASREHLNAGEIYHRLRNVMPQVALATVYNNLNQLVADRMVRKISMEGSPDRYDRAEDRHDHMICRKCGKLSDIRLRDYSEEIAYKLGGGEISYDLKVFYLCEDCQ